MLREDDYNWDQNKVLITSLTRACKLQNDRLTCRMPIQKGLFELILFELKRTKALIGQPYLQILYRALFSLAYYGLMRIGELADSSHSLKACNVHTGINKNKILLVLYTSKTHGLDTYPQRIKISAADNALMTTKRVLCPFEAVRTYLSVRGTYHDLSENFFIFRDKSNVQAPQVRTVLRDCLDDLHLDSSLYNTHSFRIGRTCDLGKDLEKGTKEPGTNKNFDLQTLKRIGRWRSNAVFRYLRQM